MSSTQVPPVPRPTRRGVATVPRSPQQGRFLLLAGLWALAVLAVTAFSYRQFFVATGNVLTNPDTMDYAQIARNMAQGHGYATSVLRPLAIAGGFVQPDVNNVTPDISRAPLYPFLLTLVATIHGHNLSDTTVVLVSTLLFLCTVVAVYRLALVLFPAPELAGVALLSAGLYGIAGGLLSFALAGLPASLATLLVTSLLIALHRAAEAPGQRARPASAFVVGVLLGLCYLTQYSLLLLVPPALVYLFFTRGPARAWPAVGACALGFLVITGIWLVRTARLCHGDPFFTLLSYGIMDNSPDYPGLTTIYRSVAPTATPLTYFFSNIPLMMERLGRGLIFYRDNLLQAFNVLLLAVAVASLFWRSADTRLNAVRAFGAVSLLLLVVVTALFDPAIVIVAPFAPLITVVAIGFVFRTVAEQRWDTLTQRSAIWCLALLVCFGAMIQLYAETRTVPKGSLMGNGLQALSNASLKPGQAVISDAPWEIAWRTGLSAVWLPANNDAYESVAAAQLNGAPQTVTEGNMIGAVLLTPNLQHYALDQGEAAPWLALYRNPLVTEKRIVLEQGITKQVQDAVRQRNPRFVGVTQDQVPAVVANLVVSNIPNFDPEYDLCAPVSDIPRVFQARLPDGSVPTLTSDASISIISSELAISEGVGSESGVYSRLFVKRASPLPTY